MKRFVLQSLLFSILIIGSLVAGYLYVPINKDGYLYAYRHKQEMLDSVQGRKIVFIGGSCAAFGLRSDMVADTFQLPVINTGLHAGIGLRFMLENTEPYLNPGDIVVIIPEYGQFITAMDGQDDIVFPEIVKVAGTDCLPSFNFGQWSVLLANIPEYIYKSVKYRGGYNAPDPVYSANTFNRYGDHITHYDMPRQKEISVSAGSPNINRKWCIYVADKIKLWNERGINVMLVPPATIRKNWVLYADRLNQIYSIMAESGAPFVVDAEMHALADTLAYDTPYHMTKVGATQFTEMVIEEMKQNIQEH